MSLLNRPIAPKPAAPVQRTSMQRVQVISLADNKVKSTTTEDDPYLPAIRASKLYKVVKV